MDFLTTYGPHIAIYISLFLVCALYAAILNIKAVHDWYTPDRTIWTVIGGNAIIGFAILAFCILGILPLLAFWLLLIANVVAGAPIYIWQASQKARRRGEREGNHTEHTP